MNAIGLNTKIELEPVATAPAESVARAENPNVPAFVGLPEAMPFGDNVNPVGKTPELIDQVYGWTPPAADSATAR